MRNAAPYNQTQNWPPANENQRLLAPSGQRLPMKTGRLNSNAEHSGGRPSFPLLLALLPIIPALVIGVLTFTVGRQMLSNNPTDSLEPAAQAEWMLVQQQQKQALVYVLMGAIAAAGVSGGLAIALLRRYTQQVEGFAAQDQDQRVAQSSRSLAELSQRLHSKTKHQEVLDLAVEQTRQIFDVERVVIVGLESQTAGSVLAESVLSGYPQTLNNDVKDPCFADRYSPKTPNSVKIIDDVELSGLPQCYVDFLTPLQAKASLSVLIEHQGAFGLLIAHRCQSPRPWSPTEVELFANIATQIGLALDQTTIIAREETLTQNLQEEVQWKNFMTDVTQYIHGSLSVEDVLHVAVQEIRRVLESDRVVVYGVDSHNQGVIVAESVAPGVQRILGRTIKDPCFEERYIQAYTDGRVRAINDIRKASMTPCYIGQLEKIGVQANLVAPVIHECKLLGLLVAHQCSGPREWRDLEIRWFTQMSAQVGYALDNAKLIRRLDDMAQASESLKQEQQVLDGQYRQAHQKLQINQANLSDLVLQTIQQVQDLIVTAQSLEYASTEMGRSRTLLQSVEEQLAQMKSLMQRETETVQQSIDYMVSLEDNLLGLSQSSASLQPVTEHLLKELSKMGHLSAQIDQLAKHAVDRNGRDVPGKATSQQVLTLASEIRERAATLEPLTAKVASVSSRTNHHMEKGTGQVADSRALAQETQQRLNKIESVAEQLAQFIQRFDHNALEQHVQVGNIGESLQETLLAVSQTLQQLESLSSELSIEPDQTSQAVFDA